MAVAIEEKKIENSEASIVEAERVEVGCGSVYLFIKRLFDVLISVVLGIAFLVPMVIISLAIRLESAGPAIFKQKRMGKNGKVFTIYKFRTMQLTAPPEKASVLLENSDEYITRFGSFLRRTSIDELPQLYNVIIGDMSLIGYRPVCLTETKLNSLRAQYGVFALRPGITGLAQVSGRDGISYKVKARLDAEYVEKCSLRMDMWCLLMTIKTVLSGEGVK